MKGFGTGLVPGLLSVLLLGCGQVATPPVTPPPSVQVAKVAMESVRPSAEFVGRTQAVEDVVIRAQVSGPLVRRHFTEGDTIEQGDLLFSIDPAPFEAEVDQADAVLAQAVAARDVAVINWRRGKTLHPEGVISDTDMDKLTSSKLQAEAAVVQAEAMKDSAELQLSYAEVKAPISGKISAALVSTGDLITPQTDLATLVQLDPFWVNFQASERELFEARRQGNENPDKPFRLEDLEVGLRLPNGQMYEQTGIIDFVDNRVDPRTGTIGIRTKFDNPDGWVLPGVYVTLLIRSVSDSQALLIPQASVQEDQQGRYVMVLAEDNRVQRRVVVLGNRYGIHWAVSEGLEAGEVIVVEGLQKVRPGAEVKPIEQEVRPFEQNEQG